MATAVYDSQAGTVTITLTLEENARAATLEQQAGDLGVAGILTDMVTGAMEREVKARFDSLLNQERQKIREAVGVATLSQIDQIKTILGR